MRLFEIFLGVTGSALLLAIAIMMSRRGLRRQYPFFFAYIVYTLTTAVFYTLVGGHPFLIFYSYWIGEVFSAMIGLLALHEAFHEVFYGFYLFWWFRLLFPTLVAVISLSSIRHGFLHPTPHMPRWTDVVISINSAVGYIRGAVFALFTFLVVFLGMRWRRYPYDIVLGFAVSSVGVLTSYVLWKQFGLPSIARFIPSFSFLAASGIWLWTFAAQFEPEPRPEWKHNVAPEQLLEQVQEYIRLAKGITVRDDHWSDTMDTGCFDRIAFVGDAVSPDLSPWR